MPWSTPFVVLGALTLSAASAPSTAPADPLAALAPLAGHWVADADPKMPGAMGWTSFEREAQGHALLRKNHAEYPASKDRPAGVHDDLMMVFAEGGQLKAHYVDNEGHVIRYTVDASKPSTLVFVSDAGQPGPRFRLIYAWSRADQLELAFEIAPPGSPEQFKPYIQAHLHRG